MKAHRTAVCLILCLLVFLFVSTCPVTGQTYYRYNVQVNSDGSALWQITYFSAANDPADTWVGFQTKVSNLLDATSNLTHRNMDVDEASLQINTTISAQSKITEYAFLWQNFSQTDNNQIVVGDVFSAPGFFSQLYGDAALQVSYPADFTVKSALPAPNERDNAAQTLQWARTQDLTEQTTRIVLVNMPGGVNGNLPSLQTYLLIGAIAATAAVLSLAGFVLFRRRRNRAASSSVPVVGPVLFESEEDKVLKLLKTHGGSMRQSDVTEACGFSKAKTSQLLSALEKRGNITRYKNGRDKIVNLTEPRVKVKNHEKPD